MNNSNYYHIRKIGIPAIALLIIAFGIVAVMACSGNQKNSLSTPQGVVNSFINRVLDQGDLKGAFELLTTSDQQVIAQNPQAYDFIMGERDPRYAAYFDIYDQMAPDVRAMIKKLVKFNARTGKEKDGYVEVGLEITYPSDYGMLMMTAMGIGARLQQKYKLASLDSIPKEERDKIIWSIKNDLNQAVDNIDMQKTATYIFPVKVIKENDKWRINLDLMQRQKGLGNIN